VIIRHIPGARRHGGRRLRRAGLALATLSSEILEKLQPMIPKTASTANPVDMTFSRKFGEQFFDIRYPATGKKRRYVSGLFSFSQHLYRTHSEEMGVPEASLPEERDKMVTEQADSFLRLTELHPISRLSVLLTGVFRKAWSGICLIGGFPFIRTPSAPCGPWPQSCNITDA
jgi:hypothetical protein